MSLLKEGSRTYGTNLVCHNFLLSLTAFLLAAFPWQLSPRMSPSSRQFGAPSALCQKKQNCQLFISKVLELLLIFLFQAAMRIKARDSMRIDYEEQIWMILCRVRCNEIKSGGCKSDFFSNRHKQLKLLIPL